LHVGTSALIHRSAVVVGDVSAPGGQVRIGEGWSSCSGDGNLSSSQVPAWTSSRSPARRAHIYPGSKP
jgi:hypothetical protein